MAGRIRLGRRGGRVVVVLATAAYVTGLGIMAAPPGQTFGGSCNGHLSQPGFDASHERGPVIIVGTDAPETIIGSRGDDTIQGNGGDDIICGGGGADNINGGDDVIDSTEATPGSKVDGGSGRNLCFVGVGVEVRNCRF